MNQIREFWKSDDKRMLMALTVLYGVTMDEHPDRDNFVKALSIAKDSVSSVRSSPSLAEYQSLARLVNALLRFLDQSLPSNLPAMPESQVVSDQYADFFVDIFHQTGLRIRHLNDRLAFDDDLRIVLQALGDASATHDKVVFATLWKNPILQHISAEETSITQMRRQAEQFVHDYELQNRRRRLDFMATQEALLYEPSALQNHIDIPLRDNFHLRFVDSSVAHWRASSLFPTNPILAMLSSMTVTDLLLSSPGLKMAPSDATVFDVLGQNWANPQELFNFANTFLSGDAQQAMQIYYANDPISAVATSNELYLENLISAPLSKPEFLTLSIESSNQLLVKFVAVMKEVAANVQMVSAAI
jgi:hypothetical protein